MMKQKYYKLYSLRDYMHEIMTISDEYNYPYSSYIRDLKTCCSIVGMDVPNEISGNDTINITFWNALYARYCDEYFFVIDEDEMKVMNRDEKYYFREKFGILIAKLIRASSSYLYLLDAYKSQEDALLDEIKSTNVLVNMTNDTPQNENVDGIYEGEDYMSTFSKQTSESMSNYGTPMSRLIEIQRNYRNLLDRWVNEYNDMFIDGGNIDG